MTLFLDKDNNLERFNKIVNKISWLKTLLDYGSEGNVLKMDLVKECVSDLDAIFTEMYKDFVFKPMNSVDEIKELGQMMNKHESD